MLILHTPHFDKGANALQEFGRWPAGVAFGLTAILALFKVFATGWRLLLLRFAKDHVIICGLGRKGMDLARYFRDRGKKVVAIERAPTDAVVGECARLGIPLLVGDSWDESKLMAARVQSASPRAASSRSVVTTAKTSKPPSVFRG